MVATKDLDGKHGHFWFQRRYLMTLLALLSAIVTMSQRLNTSFAIVDMVNTTSQSNSSKINVTECPLQFEKVNSSTHYSAEFFWDTELTGYILSAAFAGFLITEIPGGILVLRFGAKIVLLLSLIGASLCNLVSPLAARQHPYLLGAVQLVKGMFQGIIPGSLSLLIARWFPLSERGFLSPLIYIGFPIGASVGSLVSGTLCEIEIDNGWPFVFYSFGIFGLFVGLLVLFLYVELPSKDSKISHHELQLILKNNFSNRQQQQPATPWIAILSSPQTYILFIILFAQYWMMFYFVSVHPIYMTNILNIPVKENGLLSSGPLFAQAIAGLIACWVSLWLKRKDSSTLNLVRKGCHTLSCCTFASGMMGIYFSGCDIIWNTICLFIAAAAPGFNFAGTMIVAVDISPIFCGVLTGLATTVGSLSGFIIPVIVGKLTKEEQTMVQWQKMFLISASVVLVSAVIFFILGSTEVQSYDPTYAKTQKNNPRKVKKLAEDTRISSTL